MQSAIVTLPHVPMGYVLGLTFQEVQEIARGRVLAVDVRGLDHEWIETVMVCCPDVDPTEDVYPDPKTTAWFTIDEKELCELLDGDRFEAETDIGIYFAVVAFETNEEVIQYFHDLAGEQGAFCSSDSRYQTLYDHAPGVN